MAIKKKSKTEDEGGGGGDFIGLSPANSEGGSFGPDNFRGRIVKARWVKNNYGGTMEAATLGLRLTIQPNTGDEFVETLSAGKLERLVPAAKGHSLQAAEGSSAKGLSDSCNAHYFMDSLCSKGFPVKLIKNDIAVIEGTEAHFLRKPQPERAGLADEGEARKKRTFLAVSKVYKAAGKTITAAEADTDDTEADDDEEAEEKPAKKAVKKSKGPNVGPEALKIVTGLLKKAEGGKLNKAKLLSQVAKAVKGNASAKAIMDLVSDDEWLGENTVLKGGVVKLAGKKAVAEDEDEAEESDDDEETEDADEDEEEEESDDDEDSDDEDDD